MPKDTNKTQRKPRDKVLSRLMDRSRKNRSNDVARTTEDLSYPQMIASWKSWRLVEDSGTFNVKALEECLEQNMLDEDNLPSFTPEKHKDLLKSAGYEKVTDHLELPFGERYTLFVFRLKGHDQVMWLTKSGFGDALGKNRKEYIERFGRDATSQRGSQSQGSKTDDSDASENENDSNDATAKHIKDEDKDEARGTHEGVAVTDSDKDDESEPASASDSENEARNDTESDIESGDDGRDGDNTSDRSTPSPRHPKPSSRRSTSVSSQAKSKPGEGKLIFAREDGAKLRGLIKKDRSYEIEILKTAPAARMHHEKVPGFAPTVDKQFIAGLTIYKRLDRAQYKLRGCAGFERGPRTVWKVVILELTDKQLKEDLQKARTKAKCNYTGPLLCSWSSFVSAIRSNKEDIKEANKLFNGTKLAKTWKAKGIDPRSVRHQTFGPDDARVLSDGIKRLSEQLSEQNEKHSADMKELKSLLKKSKL
ncbi:hypothetical protein N0V95_009972 [Ascochyta clinopodiicola]|nr:hypothetical protein N0V95_009972 [Ascochyta clinopodiicola]